MGDSKFTAHHTNSSGDVLALEAHPLKRVGSSPKERFAIKVHKHYHFADIRKMIMLVKLVQSVEQLTFVRAVRWKFESFISPTFCQRDGIGRRVRLRSGCLYDVEGSSPSAGT